MSSVMSLLSVAGRPKARLRVVAFEVSACPVVAKRAKVPRTRVVVGLLPSCSPPTFIRKIARSLSGNGLLNF